ncbi:hypothetical protein VPH35_084634 [Triticum aestivum]
MAPPAVVGFSDLPTEAMDEIARRSGPLDNVLRSAVCKSWRRALRTARLRLLGRLPNRLYYFYMLPPPRRPSRGDAAQVTPVHGDRGAVTVLSALDDVISDTRVIGCSYGWLIAVNDDMLSRGLYLLDPCTGRRFRLPRVVDTPRALEKLRQISRKLGANDHLYHKAALAPGRRLGTYAVMLLHSDGRGLSYLRPGAASWTTLRPPRGMPHKYIDVVFHRGAFRTVSCYGEVNVWVPDGGAGLRTRRLTEPRMDHPLVWAALVESASREELLMVSCGMKQQYQYEVFRCDERQRRWFPAKDLGETAIIIGRTCSLCVSTRGSDDASPGLKLNPMTSTTWMPYVAGLDPTY